jgi:hypothetical protein
MATKDDALVSCPDRESKKKVHHCAGRTAYVLGATLKAKSIFEDALKRNPIILRHEKEPKRAILESLKRKRKLTISRRL